jgi:hypothetical protein
MLLPFFAAAMVAAPVAAQTAPAAPPTAPAAPKPFTPEETARYMELGRKANTWFFEGYADSLLAMADSGTRGRLGGLEGIQQQMETIAMRAGVVVRVVEEKMTRRNGTPQFWFEAEFTEFTEGTLVFRWLFNEEGQLVGAGMGPKEMAKADPE